MRANFIASIALLIASSAVPAFAADPCSLLSRADAALVLGTAPVQITPAGPEPDEDSPGRLSYCTYRAAASALIVSVVEFTSADEARKQLTRNLVQGRMEADDAKVVDEVGVGEKSFYGESGKGAMFVFLKKNKVLGIGIGGAPAKKTTSSKEVLRHAAQILAAKL